MTGKCMRWRKYKKDIRRRNGSRSEEIPEGDIVGVAKGGPDVGRALG